MSPPPTTPASRCPVCGQPTEPALKPFCSRRCADVDLSRWLHGAYAIAGGNQDADEDGEVAAHPMANGNGVNGRLPDDDA